MPCWRTVVDTEHNGQLYLTAKAQGMLLAPTTAASEGTGADSAIPVGEVIFTP
jgi:hypothetical protein